jgi:hypothetical protein
VGAGPADVAVLDWEDKLDMRDVSELLVELDMSGGVDAWWASTGEPDWVPEALRATLLERT